MSRLFYDDEFDALAQTITNSERSFKECAALLFPALKPESQYATLKNCLNPQHDAKLSFGQIIALCDFCKAYDALKFMCDELNHERPKEKNVENEKAELEREFVKAVKLLDKIAARREQIIETRIKAA